jgi:adenylate cyclase
MLEAVRIHDEIIRQNVEQFEGYEAEVLNNAFELAFKSAKAALQFCLRVQTDLIAANWPAELLNSPYCEQERDDDYNLIRRGLSVNMSIHWGKPICEMNKLTGRMDYIGPVVHRALKAVEAADGGEVVVTDNFLNELEGAARSRAQKPMVHPKGLGLGLNGEELEDGLPSRAHPESLLPGPSKLAVPKRPRQQAFAMKSWGLYEGKGLSEPMHLYLMVPASLSGRLKRKPKVQEPGTGLQGWWDWAKEGVASNAADSNVLPF